MRYLAKLRKKYGKVYTFFAFTKPYLVVCDPAAVRRILSDSKAFIKGEDYSKLFSICFGFGLVTSIGDKHRHDRGVLGKYFIRNNISKYMQNVNDITTQAIATTLTEEQKISSSHNIEEFFALLALRVFFAFALVRSSTNIIVVDIIACMSVCLYLSCVLCILLVLQDWP